MEASVRRTAEAGYFVVVVEDFSVEVPAGVFVVEVFVSVFFSEAAGAMIVVLDFSAGAGFTIVVLSPPPGAGVTCCSQATQSRAAPAARR